MKNILQPQFLQKNLFLLAFDRAELAGGDAAEAEVADLGAGKVGHFGHKKGADMADVIAVVGGVEGEDVVFDDMDGAGEMYRVAAVFTAGEDDAFFQFFLEIVLERIVRADEVFFHAGIVGDVHGRG